MILLHLLVVLLHFPSINKISFKITSISGHLYGKNVPLRCVIKVA